MRNDEFDATFLVLESDPVVRMDIQEMLLRHFPGWTVVVVGSVDDVPHALGVTKGPRIMIVSADVESFSAKVTSIQLNGMVGAVLITEKSDTAVPDTIPHSLIQKPFNTEQLLTAVKSALESLQSSRSQTLQ